jgi:hypothetical protein
MNHVHPPLQEPRVVEILQRIRAEFLESPGLSLTLPQARRFWALDDVTGRVVFATLVDVGFLRQTRIGSYVRREVR